MKYVIVIEWDEIRWSGYIPDLPDVWADGDTPEEVVTRLERAAQGHIEALRESGQPIPEPRAHVQEIEVGIDAA